jgi:hypothetical protein
MDEWHRVR